MGSVQWEMRWEIKEQQETRCFWWVEHNTPTSWVTIYDSIWLSTAMRGLCGWKDWRSGKKVEWDGAPIVTSSDQTARILYSAGQSLTEENFWQSAGSHCLSCQLCNSQEGARTQQVGHRCCFVPGVLSVLSHLVFISTVWNSIIIPILQTRMLRFTGLDNLPMGYTVASLGLDPSSAWL